MSDDRELLTLTEVSNRTGISMPTLQRYKKEFQDRIPSEGKGRRQRYPEESLEVFEQIKKENIKKRGRPRKSGKKKSSASSSSSSSSSQPAKARADLLTLKEVGERSGISYPTLVRYVKEHKDRIPFEGKGRRRRYHPEAVPIFEKIRAHRGSWPGDDDSSGSSKPVSSSGAGTSSRGTKKGDPSLARRVRSLEKSQERLEKQVRDLLKELKKPMTVTLSRK